MVWARRSPRGSARWWYRICMGYWSWCAGELSSCWRQYMLLDHWEVMVVIEMVVGEKDDWEVHKVGNLFTRE